MYIFLYAPITLDEYHAWFHLFRLSRAVRNEKQAKNSKWKFKSPVEFEPATFNNQNCRLYMKAVYMSVYKLYRLLPLQ